MQTYLILTFFLLRNYVIHKKTFIHLPLRPSGVLADAINIPRNDYDETVLWQLDVKRGRWMQMLCKGNLRSKGMTKNVNEII